MSEHSFTLKDSKGVPHTYVCTRHRGSEGMPITLHVAALVVEPLAAALGPVLIQSLEGVASAMAKGGGKTKRGILQMLLDDPEVLNALDPVATARATSGALRVLPPAMVYMILAYTNRDGQPLVTAGKPTGTFDEAYAGNYPELGRAVWEVARHNGFFPELSTFVKDAKRALATAGAPPASGE